MEEFNDRLRAERKRLGLSQEKFAALGGVTRDTQSNYESGLRKPDSSYIEAIARGGVDVLFLFTGSDSDIRLTDEEVELLAGYRKLDVRGKARVLGVIDGIAAPMPPASRIQNIAIHGKVEHQVQVRGNINGPTTISRGVKKK